MDAPGRLRIYPMSGSLRFAFSLFQLFLFWVSRGVPKRARERRSGIRRTTDLRPCCFVCKYLSGSLDNNCLFRGGGIGFDWKKHFFRDRFADRLLGAAN